MLLVVITSSKFHRNPLSLFLAKRRHSDGKPTDRRRYVIGMSPVQYWLRIEQWRCQLWG